MLERLNGDTVDPELLDRTLEWSEAIGCLKHIEPVVVTSSCTDFDYMMRGYEEFLQEEKAIVSPLHL